MNSAEHHPPTSPTAPPFDAALAPGLTAGSPPETEIVAPSVIPQHHGLTTRKDKIRRAIWNFVWWLLFRPSPRTAFGWRRFLLTSFGAKLGKTVYIYPSAKIYAPWNLEMAEHTCIAPDVDCYCMAKITLGQGVTISQYSYLCTGTHDITDLSVRLYAEPIVIRESAWICAAAFVGPGVTVGQGAVVGARASVFKDVEPWTVVGGNPAKFIKKRVISETTPATREPAGQL